MKALKDLGIVVEGVRQPRPSDRETAGRKGIWTAAQCGQFLAGVADDRRYLAWVLVVVCGLRRGELAGLKWPKVDLPSGLLHVRWQRAVIEGGVLEKEPNGRSRHRLAVGPALIAEFGVHQLRQQSEIDAFGLAYRRGGYVFCKEDGMPYHPKYFTDRFRAMCAHAVVLMIDGRELSCLLACAVA